MEINILVIQNELLEIMTYHAQREKFENLFFSIMGDEYMDISNKEQLSLCLQSLKENLEVQEDFLGQLSVYKQRMKRLTYIDAFTCL